MSLPSILKMARGGWPEPEIHFALSFGRHRFVQAQEEISSPGAENFQLSVSASGIACRYKRMSDGSRAIVGFILPGDFTTPLVSEPVRTDFGVTSLTAGEIIEMPGTELWTRARSNLPLSQALARSAIVDGAIARAWMANISQQPADKRTAHLLCELRHRLALVALADRRRVPLPLTQRELADALGLSEVHVNRVLQGLKRLGLIQSVYQEIFIPDLRQFEQFAGFNPDYLHPGGLKTVPTGESYRKPQPATSLISPTVDLNASP